MPSGVSTAKSRRDSFFVVFVSFVCGENDSEIRPKGCVVLRDLQYVVLCLFLFFCFWCGHVRRVLPYRCTCFSLFLSLLARSVIYLAPEK